MKQKLTLSLEADVIEKLKDEADKMGVSASALITMMLNERLDRNNRPIPSTGQINLDELDEELTMLWATIGVARPTKVKQLSGGYAIIRKESE